jgi:predicted ATPase
LEALTADLPLVLILEDLHWSDYSTLDLISYLARQRPGRAVDGDWGHIGQWS